MHVALNALHLVPGETGGMESYLRGLAPALVAAEPDLRLTIYAAREGARSLELEGWERTRVGTVQVNARSRPRRVLAENVLLPRAVRSDRPALLHNPFGTAPAAPGVPQATTIHDLNYKRHPEAHTRVLRHGMALLVPLAARRSGRVITGSEAAKRDLVEMLGVPPGRIDVVYHGPGLPAPDEPLAAEALRERYDVGRAPLLLAVAAARGHKNVAGLLEALAMLGGETKPVLVMPGYATSRDDDIRELVERLGLAEQVRFPGWVDDATLDGLYRACDCFVLPSLAEGFGLPLVEAMSRGAPIACSDVSSLPEVVGDAALLFDPADPAAIAAAMRRVLADEVLRERLVAAGREQVRRFSWDAAARGTLSSYRRLLAEA